MLSTVALVAVLQGAPVADLAFESIGNRIYIPATVGGRRTDIIIDTGAGMSVMEVDIANALNAKSIAEVPVSGAGSETLKGLVLEGLPVTIAGTNLSHPVRIAISLAGLAPLEGRPLEVILGYDFLRNYILQVDYEKQRVRLFDPKSFVPPSMAKPTTMWIANNHPHVRGTVDIPKVGRREVSMMLDTGASTSATLTGSLAEREGLSAKFSDTPQVPVGAGVGGVTLGRRLRLDEMEIGGHKLNRPTAQLNETAGGATGKGAAFDVLIGGETMRRFTVTFDYPGKKVYFEPNGKLKDPFVGDRFGLMIMTEVPGFDKIKVRHVVPNSPADKAGLREGDLIRSIDGQSTTGKTLEAVRRQLRALDKPVAFGIVREGKVQQLQLTPKEMIP